MIFNLRKNSGPIFSFIILVSLGLLEEVCRAEPSSRPVFGKKGINSETELSNQSNYTFNSTIDEIMDDSNTFDPRSTWIMKSLTDITQPFWNPEDVDYKRNNRAVMKASTILGGKQASVLISGSELKGTFRDIKQGLNEFKAIFNYSIQSDGTHTYLSKDQKGDKLLELSMEINLSQGLDPNIKLGDHVRFRYDYVNKTPLLEFGLSF